MTILVQRGTLKVGDNVVAGAHWGRVRAMHDYKGDKVKKALPGEPVEILGFDSVPEAGEFVRVVENDRTARSLAGEKAHRIKTETLARRGGKKFSLEDIFDRERGVVVNELNLVLKADVSGSLEAFQDEIAKLPQDEVSVSVIYSGVGGITESDVNLAAASGAIILGFNVRPVGEARQLADREGVEIRSYSVIYRAIDELRDAMQGMLAPEEVEEAVGSLEVRATFRASKIGVIAGCMVTDGHVTRGAKARLVRDGTVVYDGEIASLRRFNDDVREVQSGFECGVRAQGLHGRQGRRPDRGLRDQAGRAHSLLVGERSYVVLLQVHLFFPESGSLKAKRAELNRVKAHLRNRHGASVAEVDHQDTWQRSTLAVALGGRLARPLRPRGRRRRALPRRALPAGRARRAAARILG